MKRSLAIAALLLLTAAAPTSSEIEANAPPDAWVAIAPDDLILFETSRGPFVMQLAPAFAPMHVALIKAAVRKGDFSGGAVVRVQDNYVVQWAVAEDKTEPDAKVLPEFERPLAGLTITTFPWPDAYAEAWGFADGFPVAIDKKAKTAWLQHCYGMVGVGRGNAPDSGNGTELYAVIGHAPRHLDRNMASVGRIIAGLDKLSSLPRGTEALGFYKTSGERLRIKGARMVSDMPAGEQLRFEMMKTTSPTFAAYANARANRSDAFFVRPAGAVDACNVRVPIRAAAQ